MVLKEKNAQMCPIVELYTYFSMDQQYVEGVQKGKKAYLISVGNIVR